MATPITATAFVQALKKEGVRIEEVRDWRNHNRNKQGPWGPVHGIMIHHTATEGSAETVDLIYDGRSDLPGPLSHGCVTKDGTVHLTGHGRANHAGLGDDDVLRAVIAERATPSPNEQNTDGNRYFYGFECENLGNGKDPWPEEQLDAIERAAAALSPAPRLERTVGRRPPGVDEPEGRSARLQHGRSAREDRRAPQVSG